MKQRRVFLKVLGSGAAAVVWGCAKGNLDGFPLTSTEAKVNGSGSGTGAGGATGAGVTSGSGTTGVGVTSGPGTTGATTGPAGSTTTGGQGGAGATTTTATTTGGQGGMMGSTTSTTSTVASTGGGNCGAGGAVNNGGSNNDYCGSTQGRWACGKPTDYPSTGLYNSPDQNSGILIGRDAGGLFAMSALCTHNCADMNGGYGFIQGTMIQCTRHGATFGMDGSVTGGPANANLVAYNLTLGCDGILYADTTMAPVPNSQRLVA